MEVWQEAVKFALVGTAHQAPAFTPTEEPISHLLAQMNPQERESTLLRASGMLATYRRASYRPQQATQPLPPPAAANERPPAPQSVVVDILRILPCLEWIEIGLHPLALIQRALPDWLYAITEHGWRIPEEHLIAVLECGRKHLGVCKPQVSDALQIPLGEYGRWLVAQNPAWTYALPFGRAGGEPSFSPVAAQEREAILTALAHAPDDRGRGVELLGTWTKALEQNPDEAWAVALFNAWCDRFPDQMPYLDLWGRILPRDVFEAGMLALIAPIEDYIHPSDPGFKLLETYRGVWSPRLAQMVMQKLRDYDGQPHLLARRLFSYTFSVPRDFQDEFHALWRNWAVDDAARAVEMENSHRIHAFCNAIRYKMDLARQEEE